MLRRLRQTVSSSHLHGWRSGQLAIMGASPLWGICQEPVVIENAGLVDPRRLAGKIAAKTDDLVTKDAVTRQVTKESAVTEREIVDANAQLQANVIRSQRKDITRQVLVRKRVRKERAVTERTEPPRTPQLQIEAACRC